MAKASRMVNSFWILKAWPWLLSKSMVVEICKSIPITRATMGISHSWSTGEWNRVKVPKGVIIAKRNSPRSFTIFGVFEGQSKKKSTIPIGILCIKIPHTKGNWIAKGKPSIKAWRHKLNRSNLGILALGWACAWPCSAPWERYSNKIWVTSPATIQTPAFELLIWNTSGKRWNSVIPNKKAPLKANINLNPVGVFGLTL